MRKSSRAELIEGNAYAFRNGAGHAESRPVAVDLFCGVGGLSLGFLMAGHRIGLAIDSDESAVKCYNDNLKGTCDAGAVVQDLSAFSSHADVQAFLDKNAPGLKQCDAVIGGPPCQGFSVVGRNKINNLISKGTESEQRRLRERDRLRNALFESYALFVEVLQPEWFLFENVPTIRGHKIFPAIMDRFSDLKDKSGKALTYEIHQDVHVASNYGVPQFRRRFILVGRRKDSELSWAAPAIRSAPKVGAALRDLPRIPAGHSKRELPYADTKLSHYQALMRSGWLPHEEVKVLDHVCRSHQQDDVELFRRMARGARFADDDVQVALREINPKHHLLSYSKKDFQDKLHKLDSERVSWTITAHLQKDSYKFIHYRQGRTISVREAARLQSFPDWFSFSGISMCVAFRLVGNSVPPLMARAFARQMAGAGHQEQNATSKGASDDQHATKTRSAGR